MLIVCTIGTMQWQYSICLYPDLCLLPAPVSISHWAIRPQGRLRSLIQLFTFSLLRPRSDIKIRSVEYGGDGLNNQDTTCHGTLCRCEATRCFFHVVRTGAETCLSLFFNLNSGFRPRTGLKSE